MNKIAFKLWFGMMMLVVVVLILLWFFQIVFLESFYLNFRVKEITNQTESIYKLYETNIESYKTKMDTFSYTNNLSVELIDSEGNSIYISSINSANNQVPLIRNYSRIEVFQKALNGIQNSANITHPRFGNKFILVGIPCKTNTNISNVLLITMALAPVEDTTKILKSQLIYITLILLIASIIISFIISRKFTKPIIEIQKVAEKMSVGNFDTNINIKNKDELGNLAKTINHMGDEISKIDSLRKDLIANVSHELRTPLSIIKGYAETIKDVTGNNPEKRTKHLQIIIDESDRLSKIVDDILNLSQLQSGNIKLDKLDFNINNTINKIVKHYNILIQKTNTQLIIIGESKSLVYADEHRIEQVLYNLVNNAFSHTPNGSIITIEIIEELNLVKLKIKDNGRGISEDEIKYIWDKYYKKDTTTDKKRVGTGLGLAIVKGILEAHQSKYSVESIIDKGTIFWFDIPKS